MSNKRQKVSFLYTGNGCRVPKNVKRVRFHSSVVEVYDYDIGMSPFQGCKSLVEVVLNDGLIEIEEDAFQDCTALQSINIPSTVTKIGDDAFNDCGDLREVVLNEGLQKIGDRAFINCDALRSITIPSTVDEIGNMAFYYCTNLRDVVLNYGLKKVRTITFEGCTSLQSITIPSTVIEIDTVAFKDCTELREVVIYNEEVQIDDKAFNNCTSLGRFKFPGLYTRLDNIIQAGQRGIEGKMDDIPTVEWRAGELSIPTVSREIRMPWGSMETAVEVDKEKLDKIVKLIRYYEMKEATTLFELALWKSKIDQADISNPADRAASRIEVPGPVKDTILQYLR